MARGPDDERHRRPASWRAILTREAKPPSSEPVIVFETGNPALIAVTKGLPAAVLTGALAAASLLHAQARPDFSGTWTMDLARSESTRQGEPIKPPVTVIIAQTAADVRVETTRGDQKETVVYPLG